MAELNFDKAALAWTMLWDADWVTAVTFVGSNRRLVAGNQLGQILMWDLPEPGEKTVTAPSRLLVGHTKPITGLAVSPDGRWLISTSYDRTIRLWDTQAETQETDNIVLQTGRLGLQRGDRKPTKENPAVSVGVQKPAKVLHAHKEWVRSFSLTPDGTRLLTGDDKGVAILWDMAETKEIRRLQVPGWLVAAALSADARLAVTCEFTPRYGLFKNATRLWDLNTGETKADLSKDCPDAAAAGFSPDGKLVALGRGGEVDAGKIFVVDVTTGKKVRELAGHKNGATGVLFHPDGQHLLTCGRDTVVRIWQNSDGKLLKMLGQTRGGQSADWIHAMALSPDGQWLAAADMGGFVHIWSFAS
jgi:WD40 repeat protein